MHTLRTEDRDRSMTAIVSFHRVPMPRGIAFAIRDIETDGAPVTIASADRTMDAINEHNRQFGTNLHGQQALIDAHARDPSNNAAANPISLTSHCYHADATVAGLLSRAGTATRSGGTIPWWALGVDLSDTGTSEHPDRFLAVAKKLGYQFRQPYPGSASERHHVLLVKSPIHVLEARGQISRNRRS